MTWHYHNKPYTDTPEEYQGFVYVIHHLVTDRLYVGKKNFWRIERKPPLKGRKNRRLVKKETDWRDYYGSNNQLLADIAAHGVDSADRRILYLCANRTQMSYFETREQFTRDVLLNSQYYNDFIGCKITGRGLSSGNTV